MNFGMNDGDSMVDSECVKAKNVREQAKARRNCGNGRYLCSIFPVRNPEEGTPAGC